MMELSSGLATVLTVGSSGKAEDLRRHSIGGRSGHLL